MAEPLRSRGPVGSIDRQVQLDITRTNPKVGTRERGTDLDFDPMPDPLVGIVMGSSSDWPTMRHAAESLDELDVPYEAKVVSAHRTPELLRTYATEAEARGLRLVIAGAGGAAHLPGMLAAWTALPVLGVPVESRVLRGVDSLLSIVQMPAGIPVGTLAIGQAGARNAGLLAARMLAHGWPELRERLEAMRAAQERKTLDAELS